MREGSGIYSGETLAAAQVYNSASMKRAVEKLIRDNLIYTFEGEYRFFISCITVSKLPQP